MKVLIDLDDLERLLWFLQDKSEDVYERETKKAVELYLNEIKDKS